MFWNYLQKKLETLIYLILQSFSPAIKQGLILHWKVLLFVSLLRATELTQ